MSTTMILIEISQEVSRGLRKEKSREERDVERDEIGLHVQNIDNILSSIHTTMADDMVPPTSFCRGYLTCQGQPGWSCPK